MKWYELFEAGTYEPQGTFTESDLDQIVQNFRADEVPIVIGHPKTEDPAYGWVDQVKRVGKKLLGTFKQVEPQFQEMVNEGRFKRVSVRLRQTDKGWKLIHVGFLGAAPPAVPGLKPIQFSHEEADTHIEKDFAESTTQTKEDAHKMSDKEKEALREQLRKELLETEFADYETLKKKHADLERKLKQKDFEAFIQENKEKLPPAVRSGLVEFMSTLSDEVTVEFSEQGENGKTTERKVSPLQFFKDFVAKLPKQIDFSEHDRKGSAASSQTSRHDFAGYEVDEDAAELDRKIRDFAAKNNVSYEEALERITQG